MDIFRDALYEQNTELLKQISNDFYPKMNDEQNGFIYKYNKKNFTYMSPVKKDITNMNTKRLQKILK